MNRRFFFSFILLFTLFFLEPSAETVAKKEKEEALLKAPSFPRKGIWLNTYNHEHKTFKDRVTLVYFWDYNSINCLREYGILKQWYERYHPYGFEIILIHAPEFDFATQRQNIEKAINRLGIFFPVYLDNDFELWEKYGTRTWPTKFLVDHQGLIINSKGGEEGYIEIESHLRKAIQKMIPGAKLPPLVYTVEEDKFDLQKCGNMSPETYMGYHRANWWGGEIATKKGVLPKQTVNYRDRGQRVERGFFVHGLWTNRKDDFQHARNTEILSDYLGINYLAREVYVVISPPEGGGVSRIYITRDDFPVPQGRRGQDIFEDIDGNTYILLQDPRLYYVIVNEDDNAHELKMWTQKKGVAVHSFSFSNRCLTDFDHI